MWTWGARTGNNVGYLHDGDATGVDLHLFDVRAGVDGEVEALKGVEDHLVGPGGAMLQVVATKVGDQYLLHRGQGHSGEGHQLEVVDGEDGAGELCDNFTTEVEGH
ncbi:hypothetical protein H6P81_012958 [Aristolochia fimbriata]|uniref:Uncharacterized protein n=1 Tax=Aristolochia fimbriata TaxID=158543 RepID=A0AAV7EFH0_ARIFI|nr:hypothetical protein H6P81_012958 [Aristolochia fimbriata]